MPLGLGSFFSVSTLLATVLACGFLFSPFYILTYILYVKLCVSHPVLIDL